MPGPGPEVILAGSDSGGRWRRSGRRKGAHAHRHSAKRAKGKGKGKGVRGDRGAAGSDTSAPDGGHRRRRRWPWVAAVAAALLVGAGSWVAVHRITKPLAGPVSQASTTAAVVVPGAPPVLPWPAKGQGAVTVP